MEVLIKFAFSLAALAAILLCSQAHAATFNIADGDVPGLKNAIVIANSNGQNDTINLAANGTYLLTTVDNVSFGPNGLPEVSYDGGGRPTINGNGATIARSTAAGTPEFRLIRIVPINTNAITTISGVTFSNGLASGYQGGGLVTAGFVVLNNCTITNNSAEGGGGIYNSFYVLELNYCTFSGNSASGTGGAIKNNSGDVGLNTCTLVGNSAAAGAGIYNVSNEGGASLEVFNCTLSGNGIANVTPATFSAGISLGDTILSNSSLSNPSFGTITSYGYNLSTDNGGGFLTGTGDRINTDPKFDPAGLAFNGGPTQTIALADGSPAIDQGNSAGVPTDQRGFARIYDNPAIVNAAGGDGSDIGAYEAPADPLQGGTAFVVTTTADHNDGTCGGSDCTLREAIARTNALPGHNGITFAAGVIGTITLLASAGGELTIVDSTSIVGPGARVLAISSNTQSRLLALTGGMNVILGLTLRDGFMAFGPAGGSNFGGAVYNQSQVTFRECQFRDNRVSGSSGVPPGGYGGSGHGGAIANFGTLTVERCTFIGNGATGGFGADNPPADDFDITTGGTGGSANGGAIFSDTGTGLAIRNCTFVANNAGAAPGGSGHNGGNGGSGLGGGVFNLGTLNVYASTFSGNTGFGGSGGAGNAGGFSGSPGLGAGGLAAVGGTSTLRNTISAGNSASGTFRYDVYGTFTSGGYNLIGRIEGGSGFTATGDQTGSNAVPLNAQLASLANNGGPTDTMRLLSNSPAIDKGSFISSIDQRGRGRPSDFPTITNASGGDGSDIGAYEVGGLLIVTTLDDHSDGECSMSDCTLREAVLTADVQTDEENVIAFASGVTGTIQLLSSLPQVATNTSIVGPGAGLLTVRRNSGGNFGIFLISNNTSSGPTVTISGLTISNGLSPTGSFPFNSGGAILNSYSMLTISNCVITGNSAPSYPASGGAIFNYQGTLIVNSSTVGGNTGFSGGGISNYRDVPGTASVTVNNSTLSGNSAAGGNGGGFLNTGTNSGSTAAAILSNCTLTSNQSSGAFGGNGGAIYNIGQTSGSGTVTLTHCTLNNNSASVSGGGISNTASGGSAPATLRNSILKNNGASANIVNSGGTISSQGYNLSNDAAGGDGATAPGGFLNGIGDVRNTNPLLGPLAGNGGPTQTHALLANSPAIDTGKNFSLTTDQRGSPRPIDTIFGNASGGDGSDIGAVEMNLLGGPDSDAMACRTTSKRSSGLIRITRTMRTSTVMVMA